MSDGVKKRISAAYTILFPALLFLALEFQNVSSQTGGFPGVLKNIPAIFISCIFIYLLVLAVYAVTGSAFATGVLASFGLALFYTVSYYRRILTGRVLTPPDLNFAKQIKSITSFSDLTIEPRALCSVLCIIALNTVLFFASKKRHIKTKSRAVMFIISGAAMCFLFFTQLSRDKILPLFSIQSVAGAEVNSLYDSDGALMGFYTLCFTKEADEPFLYGEAYMQSLAAKIMKEVPGQAVSNGVKPNVIIIMSESFFDPTDLPGIEYSEDPVPNLHALAGIATTGNTITPAFGGLTCNPEYEFLTGNSMKFVAFGDIPYYAPEIYIDRDGGRSLASMFKKNGYKTIGLHTNTVTFYDRETHYPKLGFDEFIGEEMMPDARYKGVLPWQELISDEYFAEKMTEIIENTEEPLFFYGITMQNHTAYPPDKYESPTIKAYSDLLTEEDIAYLETYLQGVYDADVLLGTFYEYVMNTDEPTIALYFGDHLPIITQNTGIYGDLGYIENRELSELSLEDSYKMYTTPYVAFSNYKTLPETWGDVSPYFFGALLADAAGINKNLYYAFLMQTYEKFQAMSNQLFISGKQILSEPSPGYASATELFQALQFDKLFGEDYTGEIMSSLLD